MRSVLNEFGDDFVRLTKPIWKIQEDALMREEYVKTSSWMKSIANRGKASDEGKRYIKVQHTRG